jgi:outer membrane beta-barrel protein
MRGVTDMRTLWKTPWVRLLAAAAAGAVLLANPAFAQNEEEGGEEDSAEEGDEIDLDDILGTDDGPEAKPDTVAEEKRDVLRGDIDDTAGTTTGALETPDERERRLRPIKVLQPKEFLKIRRYEVTPHLGFVTNDPFVNRYLLGAEFVYHATEIFGVGISGTYSPDFGKADYKSVTRQLIDENQVSPDISKINYFGSVNVQFSPIYGKVAVGARGIVMFDVFGVFGLGLVHTSDDLEALQGTDDPLAKATANQLHPTSNFGGGIRATFGPNIAVKLEGRSMVYIETVNSTTLEMKNNFMLLGAVSFFFPGMD